jgi:hypothetical protein
MAEMDPLRLVCQPGRFLSATIDFERSLYLSKRFKGHSFSHTLRLSHCQTWNL